MTRNVNDLGRKFSLTSHGMFRILFDMRFHKCTILCERKQFSTVINANLLGKLPNIEKPRNGLVKVIGNVPWVLNPKDIGIKESSDTRISHEIILGTKSLRRVR